jgi:hypothetical protein
MKNIGLLFAPLAGILFYMALSGEAEGTAWVEKDDCTMQQIYTVSGKCVMLDGECREMSKYTWNMSDKPMFYLRTGDVQNPDTKEWIKESDLDLYNRCK